MKVGLAVSHFPPRSTAGAEGYAHRVAKAMLARGHAVNVICVERIDAGPANGVSWTDEVYDGVPVRRLSFNMAAAPDRFRWEYDNPWIGAHMQQWLAEKGPDVFHLVSGYLMSASSLQAAYSRRLPSVVTLTDFWFLCSRITLLRTNGDISGLPLRAETCVRCLGETKRRYRLPGRWFPGLMDGYWHAQSTRIRQLEERLECLRESLHQADVVISPSRFVEKMYRDSGFGSDNLRFSRHGRDFPHLTPALLQKSPSRQLRVAYLGQVARHKGVHVLLDAVRRLGELPLAATVYGDLQAFPQYVRQLRQLAADDPRIDLAGPYQGGPEGLTTVLRNADAVVVPSLWYENCPFVILEAFAHRTPVVATNLGGMAELVQHGRNGLLFRLGDAADLARQLRRLQEEPGLLSALRDGIEPIRTGTNEMDELEGVYRQLAQGKPA